MAHRGEPSQSGSAAVAVNCGLVLFGFVLMELTRTGAHEYTHFTHGFSETIFAQLLLYLGGIALIEQGATNRWTLPILLTIALLVRAIAIAAPPFLSTDIYRYVWDGMVQCAGINPFRYIPADPHLVFLRDTQIYPHINRRDYAHTIYPPGSQMLFILVARVHASVLSMKLAMLGFESVTCVVLMQCLHLLGQPRVRVLLYAWHPLCIWEIASSGHVDAVAVTMIALALLPLLRSRLDQSAGWLGAAALIKLYPLALLPMLLRPRRFLQPAGIAVAVLCGGYALYLSVGLAVFGFLPSYAQEEGISSGSRYFPVALLEHTLHKTISPITYVLCCALLLAALSIWVSMRPLKGADRTAAGLLVATTLILCFSPHYPWYFLWLLPFLTLWPWRPAFYIVIAAPYLLATRLGAPEGIYHMNTLLYGGFFLLLASDWMMRYARERTQGVTSLPALRAEASTRQDTAV